MKVKLSELLASEKTLAELNKMKLPPVLSFRIGMITKQVAPVLQTFRETYQGMLSERAVEDGENPGQYKFLDEDGNPDEEAARAFADEVSKMLEEEVDISAKKVSLTMLDNAHLEFTPDEIMTLSWMID